MRLRPFLKVLRWIVIAIIIALLLCCILFAVLQSKWAKEQVKEQITSRLKEMGIEANIVGLAGQLPFTWAIKEIDVKLNDNSELKLCHIKFRFAILPLFKGRVAINYLTIETAEYSFSFQQGAKKPFTLPEVKALLRKRLQKTVLPFPIALDHFSVHSLKLVNCDNGATLTWGAAGKIKVRSDMREFSVDLRLLAPDLNKTYLEAIFVGSAKKDLIISKCKVNIDSIPSSLFLGFDGNVAAEVSLKGPWTSWKEILYDLPLTQKPLEGSVKGKIGDARVSKLPILDRTWKFKTAFSLTSTRDVSIPHFLLASDLIRVKGKAQLHGQWEKSNAVLAFSAPDLSLLSPAASFPISGEAKGKAILQEGTFKVSFETKSLLIDHFAANTVRGLIKGSVENKEWEAETILSSSDSALPFETSFALEFVPHNLLSLIDFHFNAPEANARGYLDYAIGEDVCEGRFFINVRHLDRFGYLINEESVHGSVAAELILSPDDQGQNAQCAIVGKNMRYRDILLDDFSLSADLSNLFDTPEGGVNLLLEKVYTPRFYLDRLNFGTRSDDLEWSFYLDTEGRIENPFDCYAQGFWSKENSLFTLEVTRLFGELSETPFALQRPCQLEWGSDYLNLSPFDFNIGCGNLFTTFELSPIRSQGMWELQHFPLEIFSCIRPRFALNGLVSATGFIDATQENIEGALNAAIEEAGVLHFGKKEPFRAKGTLQAHLNHQTLQVHTALSATDEQFLDFNASLPMAYQLYPFRLCFDQTKNTSAELLAEGQLQDLFDFVNLGTNYFTGLVSCRLFLSQTLAHPSLQGELEWQNGTYENYFTGINLRHIDAQFEAQSDEIHLLSLSATDDKSGEVSAQGKISLEPQKQFPYSFEAEMNELHAVGFDMIDCNLTGPFYLTGDTKHMTAQGNLLIDEAKIHIAERLPYEIPSLPVTFVNRPPYLASDTLSRKSGFEFKIDLELTSEGNVRATGRGLNAELEGNVHVYGTNTNIAANGSLKLIKGEYIFAGKVFKLTEGEIIFNDKPAPSAYLNLNGTLSLPDIAITAMLRGPLSAPQLTFQSNPQKPTSSILALILFNKELTDISHMEAIQLASTLVSLSGGAAPDVLEAIRRSIGIDRLNISSKPGTDELAVQIGKYLTRGIMITLSQSATSSQVIVEVELPKGFVFQAETQEEEEGKFSLKWRKSY